MRKRELFNINGEQSVKMEQVFLDFILVEKGIFEEISELH